MGDDARYHVTPLLCHSGILRDPSRPRRSCQYSRRLTAILYADVASYTWLTQQDEEGTHRRLSVYLDLFALAVRHAGGAVAHFAGDAVLAQFHAASSAVQCAVDVQASIAARERVFPKSRRIRFRVGIHVGDVVMDKFDVFGEVVNIAARLQSLALPGGICVSETVVLTVGPRSELHYRSLGRCRLKDSGYKLRVYRAIPSKHSNGRSGASSSGDRIVRLHRDARPG